jgi:hypothetical protein
MCDNMPMPKVRVLCIDCKWHGDRHPYTWDKRQCPRCGAAVEPEEERRRRAAVEKARAR